MIGKIDLFTVFVMFVILGYNLLSNFLELVVVMKNRYIFESHKKFGDNVFRKFEMHDCNVANADNTSRQKEFWQLSRLSFKEIKIMKNNDGKGECWKLIEN